MTIPILPAYEHAEQGYREIRDFLINELNEEVDSEKTTSQLVIELLRTLKLVRAERDCWERRTRELQQEQVDAIDKLRIIAATDADDAIFVRRQLTVGDVRELLKLIERLQTDELEARMRG